MLQDLWNRIDTMPDNQWVAWLVVALLLVVMLYSTEDAEPQP